MAIRRKYEIGTGAGNDSQFKVYKGAKIRNQYNQVPHLTHYTNGIVTNLQLDTTNESQEVSPFPAGDNKAQINRRAQRHTKHKIEKNIDDPQKKYRLGTVRKIFTGRLKPISCRQSSPLILMWTRSQIDFHIHKLEALCSVPHDPGDFSESLISIIYTLL